jgi:signal transduction histidine kinase
LDADVASATQDLEQTNQRLQQTIDQQIATFEQNQRLHRQMAETLSFQSVGKAAGAAAHDFNNLLSIIACSLELIEDEIKEEAGRVGDDSSQQTLALLSDEINRSIKIGREILAVSGKQIVRQELFAVADWLRNFANGLPRLLGPAYKVEADLPERDVWFHCDRGQLTHALTSLVKNAAEAMPRGGAIAIRTQLEPEHLTLLVEDHGGGVAAPAQAHLFEPFYTTKQAMAHSGLGLAAARAIVRQQGGEVHYLASTWPGGATFCLRLPTSKVPS